MPPKGHHFIPRLHLHHFVGNDPKGQAWTYDPQTGRVWSAIPKETAVQTHFKIFLRSTMSAIAPAGKVNSV